MEYQIEQGTVLDGMRSSKYPSGPCYGIIINARCDIAQHKISKYYYLTAVDAQAWFSSKYGYTLVYGKMIEDKRRDICNKAKELELDGQSLLSFSAENCATVLQDAERQFAGNKRSVNKLISLRSSIDQYRKIAQIEADDLNRKEAIKSNRKEAVHYLKEIDSGKLHHYYFLPQAAYLDNEIKSKGLIVDLLEIESLTLKDAQKIANPLAEGILYQDLPPLPTIEELSQVNEFDALRERFKERLRLEKTFWLKDSSDFVQIEGTIKSPWCEHLMQRFSNVFIRIGLDNPSEDDYNTLIDGCCLEE